MNPEQPLSQNPGVARSRPVTVLFLLALVLVPIGQATWELRRGEDVHALEVFGPLDGERLRAFDEDLRERSFLQKVAVRWYQAFALRWMARGNSKAFVGSDGWLYYRDDLDYVTRPGSFESDGRAAVEGITTFRDQLAERGIPLVVLPLPPKSMVDPEHVGAATRGLDFVEVSDADHFYGALAEEGVSVLDVRPWLRELEETDAYLPQDTHWTPATMQEVALRVAGSVREVVSASLEGPLERSVAWERVATQVSGLGDIVNMMQLPEQAQPYEPMLLDVERVVDPDTGKAFVSDPKAEVLLLGDSFSRVFSDPMLGLGEGAGFGEHLAAELGTPLDVIALPGGSSRAVREALSRRAGGLDDKRVVVWQISLRELAADPSSWSRVELPPRGDQDVEDAEDGPVVVEARVLEVSRVPASFDYDFCLGVFEYEVERVLTGELGSTDPIWVAHVVMVDFERTEVEAMAVGTRVRLELAPLEEHHDLEETSWVDDTDAGLRIWFPTAWETLD